MGYHILQLLQLGKQYAFDSEIKIFNDELLCWTCG